MKDGRNSTKLQLHFICIVQQQNDEHITFVSDHEWSSSLAIGTSAPIRTWLSHVSARTAGQSCSRKVPPVTTSALPHNAAKTQGSCPQWSGEALELSQGWLEALLPSHRWIRLDSRDCRLQTHQILRCHTRIFARACYLRLNNVSHVAVVRTMRHAGTKSART